MWHVFERLNPIQRSLISALAGFLFYGSWAFYVNSSHGNDMATRAFFTQGMNSFFITLVMSLFMEKIYASLTGPRLSFWGTFVSSTIFVCLFSWTVNYVAGTPEILMTILPGCIVSAFYAFSYTTGLRRTS